MEKIKVDLNVSLTQETIQEMKDRILSSEVGYKFINENNIDNTIIEQNLGVLFDFVDDAEYCKHCPGFEKCGKNNPCLQTKLTYKKGNIESSLTPCKQYLNYLALKQRFITMDFPEEWLHKTMKDVDQNNARGKAFMAYSEYLKKKSNSWIYMKGVDGSGASFISAIMAISSARRKTSPIAFINTKDEFEELGNLYYKEKSQFDERMYDLMTCKILVLDEFGKENKNNLIRDKIVLPILDYRDNNNLFTIINSNLPINKLATAYATSKAGEENAKKIGEILKKKCKKEIILSDISLY